MILKYFGIFVIFQILGSECSKILYIHPSLSRSHVIPSQVLAKVLAEKGHEVTFISPYSFGKPIKNVCEIKLEVTEDELKIMDEAQKAMSARDPKERTIVL